MALKLDFTISHRTANTENSDIMKLIELEQQKRRNKLKKKNRNILKFQRSLSYTFKVMHRFWNRNVLMMFIRVYITIFLIYIGLLSILWGSYYKRETRMYRMKYLAIIADDGEINEVQPYIGNTMRKIVNSKTVTDLGGWKYRQ